MKKNFILFALCLLSGLALAQTNEQAALEKGKEAIKLMDDEHIDRSIELLEEAQKLDPKKFIYPYEIAYAYYLKKEYKKSIEILKKEEKHEEANDLLYQLMGNSYDMLGNSKEAIKTYEKGLKKFPNSGPLHLESGVMQMGKEDYNAALVYFEKGINAAPSFPSNYYWASKLFCDSDEKVWGLIYGELFMNIERNSKRTAEISKLLFDTYKKGIKFANDSSISVSFSKNNVIDINNIKIPFGVGIYEPTLIISMLGVKEISIDALDKVRSNFVDNYYKQGYDKRYPNALFAYQKKMKEAGHIEAYNFWILMQGDNYEFMNWQLVNKNKWDGF
ncbi:MAG: tetratricopeptide repeat protein, partial [Dysgonomonas sp.]